MCCACLAHTRVRRGRASTRPSPQGAAAQHLRARDHTGVGQARGKQPAGRARSRRGSQLSSRGPSQLRPPPPRLPVQLSLLLPRTPEAPSRLWSERERRGGAGSEPESCPGPDADPRPVRVQALLRPAQVPRPHPGHGHGHHFRSRHPAASSPQAALRAPLGVGAPVLGNPDHPSTFTRLGAVLSTGWEFRPSAPRNGGGVRAFLEAAPGGRRGGGGVVDQVGEGRG